MLRLFLGESFGGVSLGFLGGEGGGGRGGGRGYALWYDVEIWVYLILRGERNGRTERRGSCIAGARRAV